MIQKNALLDKFCHLRWMSPLSQIFGNHYAVQNSQNKKNYLTSSISAKNNRFLMLSRPKNFAMNELVQQYAVQDNDSRIYLGQV
jgi:hypothetical protein